MNLGLNEAGAHRVDPNSLLSHLFGEPHGEGVDRALAGRVVHILATPTQTCRGTRHVDDRTAAAPKARAHALHRFACAHKTAQHVDVKHALESRHAHLVHAGRHVDHPGVVDQGGEAPQFGVNFSEHGHDLGLIAHIGLHRDGVAALGANLAHHLVGGQ